jgi:hypothetical protein
MDVMKTLKRITGISMMLLLSVQLNAQTITKAYSNEAIKNMITDFEKAHSKDVMPPAEILQKFLADFPKASDIEWETAGNIYEVEFDVLLVDYKAYYDSKGNLLMYAHDVSTRQLPDVVKNAILSKYAKYHVEDVDKIYQGTEIFYKVEIERNQMPDVKIIAGEDGSIVKEWYD